MKKILVTTDFSVNSKAALRFAIQLASQRPAALTFLHVHHVLRMSTWSDATYAIHEKNELNKARKSLDDFVDSIYKSLKVSPKDHRCVVIRSPFVDTTIIEYATDGAFDFICISARGAGVVEKLFGTTITYLINMSQIPVLAIPANYRTTKLDSILYASDLRHLEHEIKQVVDFAGPLAATVELLHLHAPDEPLMDPAIINLAIRQFSDYGIDLRLRPRDLTYTLVENIQAVVKALKPSAIIMFTTQNQGFLDRLFLSSNAVEYSFLATVPLLVSKKP
jgi:nucleotide-binding universal stress UspA family protein